MIVDEEIILVRCPRCGYKFDLKRSNQLRQILDYLAINNGVKINILQEYFRDKWGCTNYAVSNILRKLGREKIIKVENFRVYLMDQWLLKQRKLK